MSNMSEALLMKRVAEYKIKRKCRSMLKIHRKIKMKPRQEGQRKKTSITNIVICKQSDKAIFIVDSVVKIQ